MNWSHICSEFILKSKWLVNSQNGLFITVSFTYILQNNLFMRVSFTYTAITEIKCNACLHTMTISWIKMQAYAKTEKWKFIMLMKIYMHSSTKENMNPCDSTWCSISLFCALVTRAVDVVIVVIVLIVWVTNDNSLCRRFMF